ncbi:MAG: hypothetical protein HPY59_04130 [Anaerolineae bacterium]|nr:hypothetical protein [Anaerolineae bacterium]
MEKEIVTKKRVVYGRVQVTLPMPVKENILNWRKHSGMGKAEFFRVAFMIGSSILARALNARKPDEDYLMDDEHYCALPDARKEGARNDLSEMGKENELS